VVGPLGAGGMGEVFRARDKRLGREVAIKTLPQAFAQNPERLARFNREAQVLATLNHANIAAIYGIEESASGPALVLELVEGEDLATRLKRGPLPAREAVALARQITLGLEEAHEKGIVHRDLKPANLKITPDGSVKILDFGLARIYETNAGPSESAVPEATTLDSPLTDEGIVHGTPAYMSPEQARGLALDKRSDIWAFGCVLFEMLTGRRAFGGKTFSDTLVTILERDPDWTPIPAATPPGVLRLLHRCLEKDPRRRLRDIGDARLELDESVANTENSRATAPSPAARGPLRWGVVTAAFIAGGVLAWLGPASGRGVAPPSLSRLTITIPADQTLEIGAGARPLAIAPDGKHVAYAAFKNGITRLYLRALDAFEPVAVAGTEGAGRPSFRPTASRSPSSPTASSSASRSPVAPPSPSARPRGKGRGGVDVEAPGGETAPSSSIRAIPD
jgi:hypothetical protein